MSCFEQSDTCHLGISCLAKMASVLMLCPNRQYSFTKSVWEMSVIAVDEMNLLFVAAQRVRV